MDTENQSRSALKRKARREEILAAAKELFSHLGYEKTTMKQVVQKAGTSIGNCYFYFPNKEALLHALVEDLIHTVWDEVDEMIEVDSSSVMQLAVTTHILLKKLLDTKMYLLFFKGTTKARLSVMGYYRNALLKFFERNPSLIDGMDPDFAAIAWEGATMILFDHIPNQQLENQEDKILPFLIEWCLRAIKCSEDEISKVIKELGY